MRRLVLSTIPSILFAQSMLAAPTAAQHPPLENEISLTAGQLIGRLREANREIIANAGPENRDSARVATSDLTGLVDRLEAAVRDNIEAPLAGLRPNKDVSVDQALAALRLAEDFAASIRTCIREEVNANLAAFAANFRRILRETRTRPNGDPRVLRVAGPGGEFPHRVRAGSAHVLTLDGLNLDSHPCGPVTSNLDIPGGPPTDLETSLDDDGTLVVNVPPIRAAGVYDLTIRLRRRKLLFFCRSTTAQVSIVVLPAAPFRIRYRVSTARSLVQEIRWNAGELKQGNDRCDGSATVSNLFRLPEGWTYASHNWIVFLNSGSEKEKEEVTGNEVFVQYRVPARGGPFCNGPTRLIHGKMEIAGTRTTTVAGPSIDITHSRPIGFGETLTVPVNVDPGDGSTIATWSVEVRFIYPDGSTRTTPVMAGARALSGTAPGGGSFAWDPESRKITISAPPQACPAR